MKPATVATIMESLSRRRPAFHSEADFQHELAWEIHASTTPKDVRVERPFRSTEVGQARIDLLVRSQRKRKWTAIELKYRMASAIYKIEGQELVSLPKQQAYNICRHAFWRDIERLERLVRSEETINSGCAILLTNHSGFWTERKPGYKDDMFNLHEGRTVDGGHLTWSTKTTDVRKRESISLSGKYRLKWRDFSGLENKPLRYLLVSITK